MKGDIKMSNLNEKTVTEMKTSSQKLIELISKLPEKEVDKLYMLVQGVKIGESTARNEKSA